MNDSISGVFERKSMNFFTLNCIMKHPRWRICAGNTIREAEVFVSRINLMKCWAKLFQDQKYDVHSYLPPEIHICFKFIIFTIHSAGINTHLVNLLIWYTRLELYPFGLIYVLICLVLYLICEHNTYKNSFLDTNTCTVC